MTKCKRILAVLLVILILFTFGFNSVYAEVNKTYGKNSPSITANGLEDAIESNIIMDALGKFLYSIAAIFENLVSWIFERLTGINTFPWADKIIFNALPLLDINFINPSSGSFFESANGEQTVIATVVNNMYYTIFTIAVALLSVCVGIMSLRLVFSAIASEKAKYKQAIVKWAMAMIMLFLSHYLISFIFMVNEKMVEVASSILSSSTANIDMDKLPSATSGERQDDIVKSFIESALRLEAQLVENEYETENQNSITGDNHKDIGELVEMNRAPRYKWLYELSSQILSSSNDANIKWKEYIFYLITNESYRKLELPNMPDPNDDLFKAWGVNIVNNWNNLWR